MKGLTQHNILTKLVNIISEKESQIEQWYNSKLKNRCFYSSVDIRCSGNKIAPIDTNLFPAGFNNLNSDDIIHASKLIKNLFPKAILLIGENHTRNLHYQQSLKSIQNIFHEAGYICEISNLENLQIDEQQNIKTASGYIPDLVILNNDLSAGLDPKLTHIKQKIIPDPSNGWFNRRKFKHFAIYNSLAQELEELFAIPKFFISTEIDLCKSVNFKSKEGLEALAEKVERMLALLKNQYQEHNIKDQPYVVVKSNYGTYGMGVMIVKSKEDILQINKKLRNQMHVTKGNVINEEVIIQEGIKTIDRIDNQTAEPLLYLMNHQQVAFLFRKHKDKNEFSNLNSVGMEIINYKRNTDAYTICCNFIARISTLAASLEI